MGASRHERVARRGERVDRFSGAAPPPQPWRGDPKPTLDVHIEDSSGTAIVVLSGELDLSTVPLMESPLYEQVRQRPAVVIDLSELSFIDSSGIAALIKAFHNSNGTRMNVAVGPGSQVERVFGIARIAEALPVYSARDEAVAGLDAARGDRGDST